MLTEIANMASKAISGINARAEEILSDNGLDHHWNMEAIEYEEERRVAQKEIDDWLKPFSGDIDLWWKSLENEDQDAWHTTYVAYQYGPNGDAVLRESDTIGWEVMNYLYRNDWYLKQPYCAECDSRGHKSGDCRK